MEKVLVYIAAFLLFSSLNSLVMSLRTRPVASSPPSCPDSSAAPIEEKLKMKKSRGEWVAKTILGGVLLGATFTGIAKVIVDAALMRYAARDETVVVSIALVPVCDTHGEVYVVEAARPGDGDKKNYQCFVLEKDGPHCYGFPAEKVVCVEEARTTAIFERFAYRFTGPLGKWFEPTGYIAQRIRIPKGTKRELENPTKWVD